MFGVRSPRSSPASRWSACSTISPGVRLRLNPDCPVAQNGHSSAQPTCADRHNVTRLRSRSNTASTLSPSRNLTSTFRVPDFGERAACSSVVWRARPRASSRARSALDRFVIDSNPVACFRWIHWKIWRPWKGLRLNVHAISDGSRSVRAMPACWLSCTLLAPLWFRRLAAPGRQVQSQFACRRLDVE